MYGDGEAAISRKTMGDVDVVYHDGLYHLFHLVLPNHDFIAHAVSEDGLHWRRVDNALFIGHPGSWDDSMLWTMAISPDPYQKGQWRMFYTGLSRRDRQLTQRIGLAVSSDLYCWEKRPTNWKSVERRRHEFPRNSAIPESLYDPNSCFPLEPHPQHYEATVKEGRQWISWRDPFYFQDNGRSYLLCAGRVNVGPVVRRGCVAVSEEVDRECFESRPPLFFPGLYDDIEVPNLFQIEGEYYLIGSIREDAKIRYWHTRSLDQPWQTYHDNVLLAKGNYAGRICHDDKGVLFWNFFTRNTEDRTVDNIMPPPKRLVRTEGGLLRAVTFEGFENRVSGPMEVSEIAPLPRPAVQTICPNGRASRCVWINDDLILANESGFQVFAVPQPIQDFRFSTRVELTGLGKCGLLFRFDRETLDGYYLSLDLVKGLAQLRDWGARHDLVGEKMMKFRPLQAGYWKAHKGPVEISIMAFGSYLEMSVEGRVILSLADKEYRSGQFGVYVESATLKLSDVNLETLAPPTQSETHLVSG